MPPVESLTYPVQEIAIFLQSKATLASGAERAQEGDIIEVRDPSDGIGLAEAHRYLWLHVEGLETGEYSRLKQNLTEPLTIVRDDRVDQYPPVFDKRRYSIPLESLEIVAPFFDAARARDPADPYQPVLPIDLDDDDTRFQHVFFTGTARSPLRTEGLIFDKAFGVFL